MCVRVFVLLLCLLSVQGGRLFAVVRGIDSLARNEKCAVVTGVVYDVQGEAIAGVNIIEKGTMNGVTTDREGKFSLEVGFAWNVDRLFCWLSNPDHPD